MDVPALLERRLSDSPDVVFALLLGSRAGDHPRPGSDWDVAVFVSDDRTAGERFAARVRLQAELDDLGPIDVIVLNDAPPLLARRALQGRRLVVKDPVAFVRFFVRSLALAGDEQVWRKLHMEARARRLEEGKFGRP